MRLRIAFRVRVAGLARNDAFELREQVRADVGVPILRDDYRRRGMRHEDVAETAARIAAGDGPVEFTGDIDQCNAARRLYLELHTAKLTSLADIVPSPLRRRRYFWHRGQ